MMLGDDQMMIKMMTRVITFIVASLASLTAVMNQCCLIRDGLIRDDNDPDDNGMGNVIRY